MDIFHRLVRVAGNWGFTAAIVSFLILIGLVYKSVSGFVEFSGWVRHTNEVLAQIHKIQTLLERAETGERGFLLYHHEATLDTFKTASGALGPAFEKLKTLVQDNAAQEARAVEIETLTLSRISMLEEMVREARTKSAGEILRRANLEGLTHLREACDKFESEELILLAIRHRRADGLARDSLSLVTVGALLSILFMLLGRRSLKKSARANLDQSLFLKSIFDSMGDGLLVVDEKGDVTHFNAAGRRLMGVDLQGLSRAVRVQVGRLLHAETGKPMTLEDSPLTRSLNGESLDNFELIAIHGEEHRILSVDTRPICDSQGRRTGALALFNDVTERKGIEEALNEARESALEASRLKSEFLATMSHEIRTPMNGVVGMTTLLLETNLSSDQASFVKTIKSSADNLLTLINQILDHSKIESGKLELTNADFNLQDCVEGVAAMFRYLARGKGVELELTFDPEVPQQVNGDALRLRQILINLIGNALKFTEKGYVRVMVSPNLCSTSVHKLMFEIKDTGPGIPKAVQSRLFQKFSQVHSPNYVRQGGSGLGLMISRELVKIMHGEIGMESVEGFGSKFWFTAEFGLAESVVNEPLSQTVERPAYVGHVLVAEDQGVNQIVVRKFLALFQVTCDVVPDGAAAVTAYRERAYDLVFMDCRMPGMDGYMATEAIRELEPKLGRRTKIVALTAEGQSGDRKRCFAAGMDEFLTKPVDLVKLQNLLAENLVARAEIPSFNVAPLQKLATFDSDGRSLAEVLIEEYLASSPKVFAEMERAAEAKDFDRLSNHAHALRSSSLTLGLIRVGELCGQLEDHPNVVENLATLKEALAAGNLHLKEFAAKRPGQAA